MPSPSIKTCDNKVFHEINTGDKVPTTEPSTLLRAVHSSILPERDGRGDPDGCLDVIVKSKIYENTSCHIDPEWNMKSCAVLPQVKRRHSSLAAWIKIHYWHQFLVSNPNIPKDARSF